MNTGNVLQIGGGNIGRALVGEVVHNAGMHIVFADVNQDLIAAVNSEGGYPVRVVSVDGAHEKYIDDISAISSVDEESMVNAIVSADLITTAVGAGILPRIAPTLARGLMARLVQRPDDQLHVAVIACENVERNTETLCDYILEQLPDDEWRNRVASTVSFPNCAVDRIVPNSSGTIDHPLGVVTEEYFQLAIDGNALKSDIPAIAGIKIVTDLDAVLAQKLFTLNGAHAAVAYWGYLGGYDSIDAAMGDPTIAALVNGLMDEVSEVLVTHYPSITEESQQEFAAKTVRRFLNPYLHDQPARVGRDPLRKLGVRDRLLRPAIMATEQGGTPANLHMAVVGGLRFDSHTDPQAVELHQRIMAQGVDETLVSLTGLSRQHPIVKQASAAYRLSEVG